MSSSRTRSTRPCFTRTLPVAWLLLGVIQVGVALAWQPPGADALRQLDSRVLPGRQQELSEQLRNDVRRRLQAANDSSSEAWRQLDGIESWTRFRDERLRRLRESLGSVPGGELRARVVGTSDGDGYQIDRMLFLSRPGLWITANLYRPAKSRDRESRPGIIICHSHHTPKTHGELQDMGATWARQGCLVVVPDQIGHGERREHPFRTAADYPSEFRVSRQDYYFRYDLGIQLQLAGQSLVGQIAHDLSRCVDLLLTQPRVDAGRIILLGSVAGGGDPTAVAAALDSRIAVAAPFNFGGPQPETRFPLPDDVETSFNYAGSGSWESTRNLRRSAADGFLPWVIVGGIAPRRLIFAHEFNWDRERDPVWKRLQRIYEWQGERERLDYTHGHGELRGQPPEASHCTHIGAVHRRRIHSALHRWCGIGDGSDDVEFSDRRDAESLLCLDDAARAELGIRPLHAVLLAESVVAVSDARGARELSSRWREALGPIEPGAARVVAESAPEPLRPSSPPDLGESTTRLRRIALETEPGIVVPLLLLTPPHQGPVPVVVAVSQQGKEAFLRERSAELAELLGGGVAVCLVDVRGTGESSPGSGRDRTSAATALSSSELMLGGTHVGAALRDLRAVLVELRGRQELDARRIAVWGDSFAPVNPPDAAFAAPHDVERARPCEPLGALLALLARATEPSLRAVVARRGIPEYRDALRSPFVHLPHDVVVPGAIPAGDLPAIAAVGDTPLRLVDFVDTWNRPVDGEALRRLRANSRGADVGENHQVVPWLLERLAK